MDRFEGKYRDELDNWKADVEEKIKGFSPIQSMKMFDVIHSIPQPLPACTPHSGGRADGGDGYGRLRFGTSGRRGRRQAL